MLIAAEVLINVNAHLNEVIRLSFLGLTEQAAETADYQWLMFYPCFYMFGIWDAYRDAADARRPYDWVPAVLAAYTATVGIMYSSQIRILGVLPGPVWLPMASCFAGLGIGMLLQDFLIRTLGKH